MKIAHIVNPVRVAPTSELFAAQPVTFESIRAARHYVDRGVDVQLFTAQFAEDRSFVPQGFTPTADLNRSVLDFGAFDPQRKLPLIADILQRLYDATDAEWMVYTNVDIALMPYFYHSVKTIIEQGYDAFTITRRTLSKNDWSPEQLPLMYALAGEPHPGEDCFVIRRNVYERFKLGRICIGTYFIGLTLALNMSLFARNFNQFRDFHLTFHLGDDRMWTQEQFDQYKEHNRKEVRAILDWIRETIGPLQSNEQVWRLVRQQRGQLYAERNKRVKFRTRAKRRIARLLRAMQ